MPEILELPAEAAPDSVLVRSSNRRRVAIAAAACLVVACTVWWYTQRAASAVAGPPSLAVLPFANLSGDGRLTLFCDALTDEVTNALAGADYLRVSSRASAAAYRGQPRDARRVGRELGVHAILEGSVHSEASGVRATLRLVNAADGFHLWTQTFEEPVPTPDAGKRLASRVERVFRFYLTGATKGLVRPGTRNAGAWHYYLQGAQMETSGEPERAVEFYRAAVAADPDYALAWAGLSHSLVTLADWGVEGGSALHRAADAARRAIEKDAEPPVVLQAVARVKVFVDRDWTGAEAALRKAIASDPTEVNLRYELARLVLVPQGRFDEAVAEFQRALALHPRGNHLWNGLALAYLRAGRPADALAAVERSLALTDRAPATYLLRGCVARELEGIDAALPYLRKAVEMRASNWTQTQWAAALATAGRKVEAESALTGIRDFYGKAVVLAALGRRADALTALERAVEEPSPSLPWVAVDRDLAGLRDDPRFTAVLRKMRLGG